MISKLINKLIGLFLGFSVFAGPVKPAPVLKNMQVANAYLMKNGLIHLRKS